MVHLSELTSLEGRYRRLRDPGLWLWAVGLLGLAARLSLVIFTDGTLDVEVWEAHAGEVNRRGLVDYYAAGLLQGKDPTGQFGAPIFDFNHPPPIGLLSAKLLQLADATGIPFKILFRAPFAALDAGTAILLMLVWGANRYRYVIASIYWLHPLAWIFSSYHGNTDSAVAFFVLAGIYLSARSRPLEAGAVLGLGLWIKLPCVLALPALLIFLPSWRSRLHFALSCGAIAASGYLPAMLQNAQAVVDGVFLYPGLQIQTTSKIQVWGWQIFYPGAKSLPADLRSTVGSVLRFAFQHNSTLATLPLIFIAWARGRDKDAAGLCGTVAACYVVFYAMTNAFAFQYFAWSIPLWMGLGWRFALPASLACTAYVYGLYAWLCRSPFLLGNWDFIGRPDWPGWLLLLRNAAVLFMLVAAAVLLLDASRERWKELRSQRAVEG